MKKCRKATLRSAPRRNLIISATISEDTPICEISYIEYIRAREVYFLALKDFGYGSESKNAIDKQVNFIYSEGFYYLFFIFKAGKEIFAVIYNHGIRGNKVFLVSPYVLFCL